MELARLSESGRLRPLLIAASKPNESEHDGVNGPRLDVLELARALGADVSYPPAPHRFWTPIEKQTASDWRQAWRARKQSDVSVYVSLSEKAGIPLSLLRTRKPHILIAHHLTSVRKRNLQEKRQYLNRFARVVVLCQSQEVYLRDEAKLPNERISRVYDKVDHRFWTQTPSQGDRLELSGPVVSVGRERRDYQTLLEVARFMPWLSFVIVASSPWSRGNATGENGSGTVPVNVEFVRGLSWRELRDLYASASLVVVPLQEGTDYAAGVNAVLEAYAMQKPLIVTRTPGIADYVLSYTNQRLDKYGDYVEQNATARTVKPQNVSALSGAIEQLLQSPKLAARLAANGRRVVESGLNLDSYISNMAQVVQEATA